MAVLKLSPRLTISISAIHNDCIQSASARALRYEEADGFVMKEEEYSVGGDNCPYSWLNEWLCEYVDGTMDPSLRRVFDKYVQANPELKAHVERLHQARELLCRCNRVSRQRAPEDVRARVQAEVECDLLRTPASLQNVVRERPVTTVASTLIVALVVGMFAGATLFAPEHAATYSDRAPEAAQFEERSPIVGRASSRRAQRTFRPTIPRVTSQASLPTLVGYRAGMSYTPEWDSVTSTAVWNPSTVQP